MQNHQSLIYREEEREMNPTCKMLGVSTIPWSPLARGQLTRPVDVTSARQETDWFGSAMKGNYIDSSNEIIRRVEKVATDKGVSMAQIALAWLLHRDTIAAPIVGMHSVERVKDIVGT
jgi:aryl-alcohol dehydrogenase-like predicted oxidoreductase